MQPWDADPRLVDDDKFPKHAPRDKQILFLLNYAVLAPSAHNTQPWKLDVYDNVLDVYADTDKALSVSDPLHRELVISCGALIGTFEQAARYFSCKAHVSYQKGSTNLLARIELYAGDAPDQEEARLFHAIKQRHIDRTEFQSLKPQQSYLQRAQSFVSQFALHLDYFEHDEEINALADLVAMGDRIQFSNPAFRQELSEWLSSRYDPLHQGVSLGSMGIPDMFAPLSRAILKYVNLGEAIGKRHKKQVENAGVMGLMSSTQENANEWLNAGRALSAILLYFTSNDIQVTFYNEALEIEPLRSGIQQPIGGERLFPQMLFRIGFSQRANAPLSTRRTVEDCLIRP